MKNKPEAKQPPRFVVMARNNIGTVSCVHDHKTSFRRRQANEMMKVAGNLHDYSGFTFAVVSEKKFNSTPAEQWSTLFATC